VSGSVRTRITVLYGGLFTIITAAVLLLALGFQGWATAIALGPGGAVCLAAISVIAVLGFAVCWWLTGRLLRPLHRITATARRLSLSTLHERIALDGPDDELRRLADTFDAMLDRLEDAVDSQRRFIANASHELRTPLTITRTLIEVALLDAGTDTKLRQLGTTLLAVNQRHERLTDGLLTLASGEQRAAERHPVALAEVVEHVVAELRPVADKAAVAIETALEPGIVSGDAFLLERLIQNLIENAIQYNIPETGWVRITTATVGDSIELVVENTGPSVPVHEVPGLFEPFRRLAATERLAGARGTVRGAGLGLSIVRSVARTHGGEVQATPRVGGGLVVRVRIPVAPEPSDS
jgi:signal transduction histidine kinase